jgi:hypothetical protein
MYSEIRTYTQTSYTGVTRTMYTAKVQGTTYHADSIDKLNYFINNHVEVRENTF